MAAQFSKSITLSLINLVIITNLLYLKSTSSAVTTATPSSIPKPRRFVTKLIHRDSIFSPYYNPNETLKDRAIRTMTASMARVAYLEAKANAFATHDVRAGLVAEDRGRLFMAKVSIGEPPVPQLLTIDTGSSLLWVQCLPCIKCYEQTNQIFDPSKSSTYTTLPCTSAYCSEGCANATSKNCTFNEGYVDETNVSGLLATENFTLDTSDEGLCPIPNVVFGCAHDNNEKNGQSSGILGLDPSNISFAVQLGSKFSYCIGSIRDPKYPHNQLVLGDGAKIQGTSTPLDLYNDLYYLTIDSIALAERRLEIDPELFKRTPSGTGGTLLDSGATYTYLAKGAYDVVSGEVQKLIGGTLEKVVEPRNPSALCYKGTIGRDLIGFPDLVFNFADGAEVGLDIHSLFQEYGENEFCMALKESPVKDLNIVGVMAQQTYNVAYDIAGKKVYFQKIDCQLLDD